MSSKKVLGERVGVRGRKGGRTPEVSFGSLTKRESQVTNHKRTRV